MTNAWRLPLILCLSVVFGAPVLGGMIQTSDDLLVAGLQYIAALALAWGGVTVIGRMIDGFAHHNRIIEHDQMRADAMAAQVGAPTPE